MRNQLLFMVCAVCVECLVAMNDELRELELGPAQHPRAVGLGVQRVVRCEGLGAAGQECERDLDRKHNL